MNTQHQKELLLQKPRPFYKKLSLFDWFFAVYAIFITIYSQATLAHHMDIYEQAILWGSLIVTVVFAWYYKPMRPYLIISSIFSYIGILSYLKNIDRAQTNFFLKYFFSSQAAIMWMCALVFIATFCYFLGLFLPKKNLPQNSNAALSIGSGLTWAAALMGLVGLLMRWYESYLISPEAGHIPVSNLYEVLVLFIVMTLVIYLYYEGKSTIRHTGGFIMAFVCITVIFLIWYSVSKQAQVIQPLVPALQSWWMKIHVPTNIIGYGAFTIAAMLGVVELLVLQDIGKNFFPTSEALEEMMYKAISLGFLFFTIATVTGAIWADSAWGSYWSWDPKETWALITWLSYAIWLHLRLVAGWRGKVLAWWAIVGLLITTFAFLGVNLFLSGNHSYGTL